MCLQPLPERCLDRVREAAERQLGNHDGAAVLALEIDPLAHRLQAEDDRAFTGIDVAHMGLGQFGLAQITLHLHTLPARRVQQFGNLAHLAAGREDHQRPLRPVQLAFEPVGHLARVPGRVRFVVEVRNFNRGLALQIEGGGQTDRHGAGRDRRLAQEGPEISPCAEGGRGEDRRVDPPPKHMLEEVGRIGGRGVAHH